MQRLTLRYSNIDPLRATSKSIKQLQKELKTILSMATFHKTRKHSSKGVYPTSPGYSTPLVCPTLQNTQFAVILCSPGYTLYSRYTLAPEGTWYQGHPTHLPQKGPGTRGTLPLCKGHGTRGGKRGHTHT